MNLRASILLPTLLTLGLCQGCARRAVSPVLTPVSAYVGTEYSGQLPGSRTLAGMMLREEEGVEYALEYLDSAEGQLIVLQRMLGRNADGKPRWRVLSTVRAPRIPRNHQIVFYACSQGEVPDANIFAVVEIEEDFRLDRVLRAWRAEPASSRFVTLPSAGIICENEGFEPPAPASARSAG